MEERTLCEVCKKPKENQDEWRLEAERRAEEIKKLNTKIADL